MRFDDDKSLLRGLKQRDAQALEAAIGRYGGYVMAVALRTFGASGCHADAEEASADAFAALWKAASGLRTGSSLKPWLAVVTRNAVLTRLRSLHPELAVADVGLDATGEPAAREPAATADGRDERQDPPARAVAAVDSLPAAERELLERHYIDGESLGDIAVADATTIPAVKSRLYRSRKTLRERLGSQRV